jgi:TorA maturation chaperone TorD
MTLFRPDSPPLIRRAEHARFLSRGFSYPDRGLIDELAPLIDSPAWDGPKDWDAGQLQSEYTALFARNVPCPLNASAYGVGGMGAVHDLARIAAFYGAFGFQVSAGARELPDHLCVELEFLGVLSVKEAFADEQGWPDRARTCSDARAKFASEYMASWVPQLSSRLEDHARTRFYPSLCRLVLDHVANEAEVMPASAGKS